MKFFININQEKLVEMAPEANLVHGAILDYLFWFCNSASEEIEACRKVIDGKKFTWINYDWLIKDMPLLKGKSKASLVPIFVKLEQWGFINTYWDRGGNGGGRKYIQLTSKVDDLYRDKIVKKPHIKNLKRLQDMKKDLFKESG